MEIHRLTTMQSGYDVELFNRLYKETTPLRNSLAFQIDHRRYGVTPDIIRSWFDDKFIFVFNKYYNEVDNNVLKAYIINALKTFKLRVLRKAYSKYNIYNDEVRLEDTRFANLIPDDMVDEDHEMFMRLALTYLKKNLSPDAFTILDIDLNPPPYILNKIKSYKTKIPAKVIAEYLDLDDNPNSISYITNLRKEISDGIVKANKYFKEFSLQKSLN